MLHIYTGDGKGKTTAAIGSLVRGYGAGKSCALVCFDKTPELCNELGALLELGIHAYVYGINRVGNENFRLENREADYVEAKKALKKAEELSHSTDILVLDEFLNAMRTNLIATNDALELVKNFPPEKHLILTGRGLHPELEFRADLISEIQKIKHPFESGTAAVRGIDY